MAEQNVQANPGTDNSQAPAVTEGSTGGFLDGLTQNAGNDGKAKAADATQAGSESGQTQAVGQEGAPSAQPSGQSEPKPWKKQLKADLQSDNRLDRFEGFDPLARAYLELEGKLGKAVTLPEKDAPAEAWDAYYERIGRPKTPAEYALERPKDLPQGIDYSDDSTKEYRAMAHELGFTQDQAARLHAKLMQTAVAANQANAQARAQAAKECGETLKAEFGSKYDEQIGNIRRVVKAYGNENVLKKISARGLDSDPDFMRFLASVGGELREDTLVSSDTSPSQSKSGFDFKGL
jgi:hypothetical protein